MRPNRRDVRLLRSWPVRYLFAIVAVASAFGLRLWLLPLTGTGAPFVLFFAAILVTSLFAGVGPGIVSVALSMPVAAYVFVVGAGYRPSQAITQALLFALDGTIVIYLSATVARGRQALESTNRQLRRANEEATVAAAHIREFIELAPDAFFLADLDARLVDVNAAACAMLGYGREELIGKTIFDIIPPEDAAKLETVKADLLVPGMVSRGEWTQLRKDGVAVPVEVSSKMLPGGRWQAFVRDITALKESEQRLTLALEAARMGTWDSDLTANITVRSRRHDEIFGHSSPVADWSMNVLIDHVVPEDRDHVRRSFETAFVSGVFELQCRLRWKDGSIHWISSQGRVYRNPQGVPIRMLGTIMDITERRGIEEALRRSEAQFRGLIENMPDGVFVNQDGRVAYANRAFAELLGYEAPAGIVGQPIPGLFHPDDVPVVAERVRALRRGMPIPPRELRMRRREGTFADVETTAIQALFEGRPGIVVIVRDLTARRRAEEALRLSEAKFSGIISISADAIISIDDERRITIFNEGAEKIFGYTNAEAVGESLELLIPERFRGSHGQRIAGFAAGDGTARRIGDRLTTIAGRRKNGEEFPAEAAISKLEVGDKTLLTVALRDVTERNRLEKEQRFLAEASAALASTLDYEQTLATVAGLVVRDFADWCIVEVMEEDEHLRRLKVASADPAQAALCARFEQLPIDRDRSYLIRPVVETREPLLIEHISIEHLESAAQGPEHLEAFRAIRPSSLMAVPLLRHGEMFGTMTFISSQPAHVFGRVDLRLALLLADRAAVALENARLYRASVHATQLRDQVLGVVAHDLRNPLNAILMQASALQRRPPEPERRSQKPRLTIDRAARRMNRLIQDLLDVARMEAGQLSIEGKRLGPRALVIEAAEMQRPLASSSDLDIRVDVEGDLPEVWGDRDRLLQVFENLIGNATKFTGAGGHITVGAALREHEVVCWVADTGCGIEADSLPHVFDRFWQASRARRGGAGLGLAITRGIIEAHGGHIWVESTPGRGTTFFFSLPRAHPSADQPADVLH